MTLRPRGEFAQAFERSFPTPDAARSIYEEQEFHRGSCCRSESQLC